MFSSTGSNHPIIPRQTDLILSPHYVTFHSSDRDKTKYPSSSQWATRLPENVNSIRSMHLVDCYLPTKRMYVFKNDYQNLAFMVNINTNSSNKCHKEEPFEDNCLDQSKCTPRLNLSRPLVPHSNVKFNEGTKQDYAGPNNNGPYQIPTIQLQNSFSDPPQGDNHCTSYQNNQKGLNNLYNNVCENKKITCQEPEPEPEPETKDCNIWAPRSMCAQETAMLRVNGTIPPYIKKMREIEESVKPPHNYNYDGCHAHCNPTSTSSGCDQYMIRIKEGVYTGDELAMQLQLELNNATGFEWKVKFSEINGKFYFYVVDPTANNIHSIQFRFDWKINYQCQNFSNKNQPTVWDNDHWWGLGYYLGFDKKAYTFYGTFTEHQLKKAEHPCKDMNQDHINLHSLQMPNSDTINLDTDHTKKYHGLVACNCANLEGPTVCYMELEKYNNCDEIYHSSSNTSSTYNNTFSGATKAVFAKLEIGPSLSGYTYFKSEVQYITHFENQLEERITKLEFKFRFHDGRYVCFCDNKDMNFSLQFNCTKENPLSKLNITAIPGWTA